MTEPEAIKWVENANGLTLMVSKNKKVTLTDGSTFEVYGTGIVDAVNRLQKVMQEMSDKNNAAA